MWGIKRWGTTAIASAAVSLLWAGAAIAQAESFFPFGVYDKSFQEPKKIRIEEEITLEEFRDYQRQVLTLMNENGMNVLLSQKYRDARYSEALFDLASELNIKIVMPASAPRRNAGAGNPMHAAYSHQAVIAYKCGDEPKDEETLRYLRAECRALHQHYDAPIITPALGERLVSSDGYDRYIHRLWRALDVEIRTLRYYPFRREHDLVRWSQRKLSVPPQDAFRIFESIDRQTSWWYVMQTFGKGYERERRSYWRFPTSRELTSLGHLALAHGARGILGYSLQNHKQLIALVDENLQPSRARDGSIPLEAYARLGNLTATHADFLLHHRPLDIFVASSRSDVIFVPRIDPETQQQYVYAVNLDAEQSHSAIAFLPEALSARRATDIYTGERIQVRSPADGRRSLHLDLRAGQGRAIRLD